MTPAAVRLSRAPRLVAKVLGFSFGVIVLVLAAVFLVLSWQARTRLSTAVTANLELSQQRFGEAESRRRRDRLAQAAMLAESPTLKAAVDTFQAEGRAGGPLDQLTGTVQGELAKVQQVTGVPALSVTDARGRVVSTVGPLAGDWPAGLMVRPRTRATLNPVEAVVRAGARVYLVTVAPLVLGDDVVGEFLLAAPLDDAYARHLAADANTDVAVVLDGAVVAGAAAPGLGAAIAAAGRPTAATLDVHGDEYVVRRLSLVDDVAVYAIGSLGTATRAATADAATLLAVVGLGALLLAGLGSAWLARTLVRPIDELTRRLARMADERRFDEPLAVMGASRSPRRAGAARRHGLRPGGDPGVDLTAHGHARRVLGATFGGPMTRSHLGFAGWLTLVWLATPALAQEPPAETSTARRVAFDTVSGWQDSFAEDADWPTQVIVDAFAGAELAPGWQVSVRPVVWRLRGEWEVILDQASVRYETRRGANWRFEAGKFPMPTGLGLLENRANTNPGILWWHRPYYTPSPSLGTGLPRVSLISTLYPWGAQAAVSGQHWDLRVAAVDRPAVEFWRATDNLSRRVNLVAGGGITPRQGLRFGVGGARGRYAEAAATLPALDYTTVNAETDFAFGYTRLSGEWVRSRFESPGGTRVSEGWTAQAQHTLTPRVFVHSRISNVRAPRAASAFATTVELQRFRSIDSTVGYLLTPEITLRAAHTALRAFDRPTTDHQLGLSVIWSRRWW